MKQYILNDKTYNSLWELRRDNSNLVFPSNPTDELLAGINVTTIEIPDPASREPTVQELIYQIDNDTSTAIFNGFDYQIDGVLYHFSYDALDQQNFADTANACILSKIGNDNLPTSVNWNTYTEDGTLVRLELDVDKFLDLYTNGALVHKALCMEEGGVKKAELLKS